MAYELVLQCQTCRVLSERYAGERYLAAVHLARGDGWVLHGNARHRATCPACRSGNRSRLVSPELRAWRAQIDAEYAPLRDRKEAERREFEEAVFAQGRRSLPPHLERLTGHKERAVVGFRQSKVKL
jgi:hypothetical protein